MIEKRFDVPFVARLARKEKQIQQHYRPIIAIHKWFARRPGALFRSLLLSEFEDSPLRESYYRSNDLSGLTVVDPFMGGGTPLIEANRLGCDVVGRDINPMSYWIVNQSLSDLDNDEYLKTASLIRNALLEEMGSLYVTRCEECGFTEASAKYFLWVKTVTCEECGAQLKLFPSYVVARDRRHTHNVVVCSRCGELNPVSDLAAPGDCHACGSPLQTKGPASRARCVCGQCGAIQRYPRPAGGPPEHDMYAIEYHCPQCKSRHSGRYFKRPDADDLDRYSRASRLAQLVESPYLPQEAIPEGDETNRLHRWGYRAYTDLFNARQIVSLVRLCELVADVPSTRVREALATNVSDLLRYQNMLCRYDSVALKSLDIFSVHGFPVGLQQCESNILGIPKGGSSNIGSGGWTNIVTKFAAAKQYCEHPYEVSNRTRIHTTGERIGGTRFGESSRRTKIECASATDLSLPHGSVAAVLTDPPYFANVQYAELMDFCYVWLRRIMGESGEFSQDSTRNPMELTGNETLGRGLGEFAAGLSEAFSRAAAALVPGGPFVFTYHHNSSSGYWPVIIALLDAGLTCTVSIPCPAEMGASIHINGTGSSTVDSVFVCRSTGSVGRRLLVMDASGYSSLITNEARLLEQSGLRVRDGDLRCMILGHLARMTVWNLRQGWDPHIPMQQKLALVETTQRKLPTWKEILALANHDRLSKPERLLHTAESEAACYGDDSIPF